MRCRRVSRAHRHVNGKAVQVCTLTAADAVGKKITTIEGLAPGPARSCLPNGVVDQVTSPTCRICTNVAKRFLVRAHLDPYPPWRQSYQPKAVGPAFVGVIRIRQRRCLIMAVR